MRYLFNLFHFLERDYSGKLTQGEKIFKKQLSEHFKLSKRIATRSQKIAKDDWFKAQPIGKSRVTEQLS